MEETFTIADWAKEIAEHDSIPQRDPDGVTILEFAEMHTPPISDTAARKKLNNYVRAGTHYRVWTQCPDGQRRFVYYKK